MSYLDEAESDAQEMVENFRDEIEEQLADRDEASKDLFNDYPGGDNYHHENHVDRPYQLKEAADLLDELSDYEETDTGLWEGLPPRDAIGAQAAFTYGNAVLGIWQDQIDNINSEYDDLKPDEDEYDLDDHEDEYEDAKKKAAEIAINRTLGTGEQEPDLPEPTRPEEEEELKPAPKKGPGFEFFN